MQNNEIPLYVTDTHSLIWYLTDSPKLSASIRKYGYVFSNREPKQLLTPFGPSSWPRAALSPE